MRVFIGSYGQKRQEDEFISHLQAHCSGKLSLTFLKFNTRSGWTNKLWKTPYECLKYSIPELCSYKGRAVYIDVGCKVLTDLSDATKIFRQPYGWQHAIGYRGEFAVIDCSKFDMLEWPKIEKMKRLGWNDMSYVSHMSQLGLNVFGTNPQWLCDPPENEHMKIVRNAIPFSTKI